MASEEDPPAKVWRNRLANEISPYLQQHASNPVDWYPWCEEAIQRSRDENKLIFCTIGYASCHWCHMMARDTFENEEIGRLLNERYIAILVDREERPDIDRIYLTFIHATHGGGGWPMTLFLLPNLKPFVGGTYFPPCETMGRPGLNSVLNTMADQWIRWPGRMKGNADRHTETIKKLMHVTASEDILPGMGCIQRGYQELEKTFEPEFGGFGSAPKFPQPVGVNFLFRVYERYPNSAMGENALRMSLVTLKGLAKGGIYDCVWGGFHHYSTDKHWHMPHFEKLLIDQAQMAAIYADAYQITKDEEFADVVRHLLTYVIRDLSDKDGGFYSSEDSEAYPSENPEERREGAMRLWTLKQIKTLFHDPLPNDPTKTVADLFSYHYGVKQQGNIPLQKVPFREEVEFFFGKNLLSVRGSVKKTAEHFDIDVAQTKRLLAECREKLLLERQTRPKPDIHKNIITGWNGLMISGFARAARALDDPAYLRRAQRAAWYIKTRLYDRDRGVLLRYACRDELDEIHISPIDGYSKDYSYVIRGLLDLYETDLDQRWMEWAWQLQEQQTELFWDMRWGAFYSITDKDPNVLVRIKEDQDIAAPSANSMAAMNLLRFTDYLKITFNDIRGPLIVFKVFREQMNLYPLSLCEMLAAFVYHSEMDETREFVIAGERNAEDTKAMLSAVNAHYLPNKLVIVHDPSLQKQPYLSEKLKYLSVMKKVDGKATAYICHHWKCLQFLNDPEKLKQALNPHRPVVSV